MLEELCNTLREKRRSLDLTIEEVVDKTKLHPTIIRNIEEGMVHAITPAYLKGFLKIYAEFLRVDISDALEEAFPSQVSTKVPTSFGIEVSESEKNWEGIVSGERRLPGIAHQVRRISRSRPMPPYVKRLLLLALVVVIVLWGVVNVFRFIGTKFSAWRSRPRAQKQEVAALAPSHLAPSTPAAVASSPITVSLTAKKNCFLRVKVDGKLLFEGVLKRGISEAWKGEKEIEFKISDGSAVHIEVNGSPIPRLSTMRKPIKSLKITPAGILVDK